MSVEQVEMANRLTAGTLMSALGITFIPSAAGTVAATMPVDERTHQPMGLLHGGATAALAESLGSVGSFTLIDRDKQAVVGVEVNVNHLKGVRSGTVTATGTLVHQGRSMHVWDIRVKNEADELVAICRLTNMVLDRRA